MLKAYFTSVLKVDIMDMLAIKDKMFYNKRHIKMSMNDFNKKDKQEVRLKENDVLHYNGEYLNFVTNKAQKIVTALYLVTGSIADEEPLKKDIRQKSLVLVDYTSTLKDDDVFSKKDKISSTLDHLKSLIFIASTTGYVSLMNAEVLEREINKLSSYIKDVDTAESVLGNSALPDSFFDVDMHNKRDGRALTMNNQEKGEAPMQTSLRRPPIKDNKQVSYKRHMTHTIKDTSRDMTVVKVKAGLKPRKKNRRDFILNFLSKDTLVSIKDIAESFDGCSEKTIQRELTSLVDEGIVLKEGARRWSKYRLA